MEQKLFIEQAIKATAAGRSPVVKKNEGSAKMKKGAAQSMEQPGAPDFYNLTPIEKSLYCSGGHPYKK